MQEKSTKPFQQKLDALTELPDGFSFDATQSWNRMEENLTGRKRKNKKALWYMAAAASIVLIVSITYFNQQERINPVAVKPEQTKKEQPVAAESKSNEVVLTNETKETVNTPVITKTKTLPEKKPLEVLVFTQETKQPELITQINTPQEIKIETGLPETTIAVAPLIATPVKRKIIHINQLGKESFLTEQQNLSVKEEKTSPEIITEETITPAKPWYKKFKSSHRTNNN
jgi:hypothetical protein